MYAVFDIRFDEVRLNDPVPRIRGTGNGFASSRSKGTQIACPINSDDIWLNNGLLDYLGLNLEIFRLPNISLPPKSVCFDRFFKHSDFRISSDKKITLHQNRQYNLPKLWVNIFCEQNNFQVTKRGLYLAKYRPNLLATQFACLRPGRSETVSSPSDTGDWIIQSTMKYDCRGLWTTLHVRRKSQ